MWSRSTVVSRLSVLLVALLALPGCSSTGGGPARLYSFEEERAATRVALSWYKARYLATTDENLRVAYRNHYIGESLKFINSQYYAYETSLTQERQRVGLELGVASIGLSTGGALSTAADSSRILSGLAGAVTGVKGQYESEVLFAKTLQIIQAQMRSNRDTVAIRVIRGMKLSTRDYPLPMAEADLEDFYGSGTLTAGLLKTAESVARDAASAEVERKLVIEGAYVPDDSSEKLRSYIFVNGVWNDARYDQLAAVLAGLDRTVELYQILDRAEYAKLREELITAARARGIAM